MKNNTSYHNTAFQLKMPVDVSTIISADDSVYSFCEVMDHIDLQKFIVEKDSNGLLYSADGKIQSNIRILSQISGC